MTARRKQKPLAQRPIIERYISDLVRTGTGGGGGGGGTGDVVGPAGAVNDRVVAFDGVTGKLIKDSGSTVAAIVAAGAAAAPQGDVVGPAAAVDLRVAIFDGVSGKLIKDGGLTLGQVVAAGAAAAPQGDVVGPAGATADRIAVYDGATGKLVKDGGITIADWFDQAVKAASSPTFAGLTLSGGQLVFPAVQNPSAGVNTLDDYEEGTWTPVLGGTGGESGQAYSIQSGQYVKVGRLVVCSFRVVLSTLGTITGIGVIKGLPFAPDVTGSFRGTMVLGQYGGFTTAITALFGEGFVGGASEVRLGYTAGAAVNPTNTAQATFSNTTELIGKVYYLATA